MDIGALDWEWNPHARSRLDEVGWPDPGQARAFHRALPGYAPTPLWRLAGLGAELGVERLWIKDEAARFGLNAFKVLGASYGVYRVLLRRSAERGVPPPVPGQMLTGKQREGLGSPAMVAATEGNHGRAVAWAAARLGLPSVIFMRRTTHPARVRACEAEGATVVRVEGTYDDAVRAADQAARENDWELVSDMGYPGYLEVPRAIADGYRTLFSEVDEALATQGEAPPTCVVVQAGVGGLASAAVLQLRQGTPPRPPLLVTVEPREADCLLESVRSVDAQLCPTRGGQRTLMAGLNCGTPSLAAWPLLRQGVDLFVSIEDPAAVEAVRRLAHPVGGDAEVQSGASGAAGLGALLALREAGLSQPWVTRCLGPQARVLLINTEGPLR
ncbi:MAG: diaminopropionate ammonia-lyase [Myxococcota bacterium]|nr:diaminopropionate ammonia-lyase [Myxococcota bacterium]